MKLYDNDAYRDEFTDGVYELLSDDLTWDRANQIIDLFDASPAVEAEPIQPNDPLTLEELRKMDGEPVWCISLLDGHGEWAICHIAECAGGWYIAFGGSSRAFGDRDTFGKAWIAYRRKPEKT